MSKALADIREEICTVLSKVAASPSFKNLGRKARTRLVVNELGRWADAEPSWTAYYSDHPNKKQAEWLFDVAALELVNGGWLASAPVVFESELGSKSEVHDDFQRLLLARADLRVMVFQTLDLEHARDIISELEDAISRYKKTKSGDSYLFACYLKEEKRFYFQSFVARAV